MSTVDFKNGVRAETLLVLRSSMAPETFDKLKTEMKEQFRAPLFKAIEAHLREWVENRLRVYPEKAYALRREEQDHNETLVLRVVLPGARSVIIDENGAALASPPGISNSSEQTELIGEVARVQRLSKSIDSLGGGRRHMPMINLGEPDRIEELCLDPNDEVE